MSLRETDEPLADKTKTGDHYSWGVGRGTIKPSLLAIIMTFATKLQCDPHMAESLRHL